MIVGEAKLTTKGQVTVPKPIREELGVGAGDRITFEKADGGFTIRKHVGQNPFDEWIGYLKDLEGQDPDELIEDWRGR